MTRVAVTGATGAMGSAVRETAADRDDVTVGLLISRSDSPADGSVPVVSVDDLSEGLDAHDIDVLVDFSVPSASTRAVTQAATTGVGSVVGTTGFDDEEREILQTAATSSPVLVAPNFSRGIQALIRTLETAVEGLPGYDIELTETHHNRKRDAPSGTAERLLETIEEHRPEAERVHGRSGVAPRSDTEIGVHARRAGTITGEHEILFAGNDETIQLTHRAESRRVFAAGALDAAVWLDGQSPGWYGFDSVVST